MARGGSTSWVLPVVGLIVAYLIITRTGILNQLTSALKGGGKGGGPPSTTAPSGKGGGAANPDKGKGTPGWYSS